MKADAGAGRSMILLPILLKVRSLGSFGANTVFTVAANLTIAAMGMGTGIIAARLLGAQGRGELAAIQTWPSFIGALAMMGMPEAIIYHSARDSGAAGEYLGSGILLAVIASLPFMPVAYFMMPVLLHAQSPTIIRAARWYLFIVPIYATVGMLHNPLRGLNDFVPWNILRICPLLTWFVVLALAWIFGRTTPTVLAGANLAGLSALLVPSMLIVRRRIPRPFLPDYRNLGSMLQYGIPCVTTKVPQVLNLRLDQMLMAAIIPPQQLGLYVVAVAWSSASEPLIGAVGAAILPSVASANKPQDAARRFGEGARIASLLAFATGAALTIATPLGIAVLFGAQYRGSIPAALILVPAGAVLGLNYVLQEGLRGLGQPYAVLQAEFAGLVVTGLALVLMLRPLGITGAALSSLLGYSTVTAGLLANAKRFTGSSPAALLCPRVDEIRLGLRRLGILARASG
jgi:O-antigen/teichoic acid export membrane protein